jgi:hypothetical protein
MSCSRRERPACCASFSSRFRARSKPFRLIGFFPANLLITSRWVEECNCPSISVKLCRQASRSVACFRSLCFRTSLRPSCLGSGLIELSAQFCAFSGVSALGSILGHILFNLRVHGAKDTKGIPHEAMTVLYSLRREGRDGEQRGKGGYGHPSPLRINFLPAPWPWPASPSRTASARPSPSFRARANRRARLRSFR